MVKKKKKRVNSEIQIPFPSAHGTYLQDGYTLGHKTSLNTFKKSEITLSIFPNHEEMKLEIESKRKTGKFTRK